MSDMDLRRWLADRVGTSLGRNEQETAIQFFVDADQWMRGGRVPRYNAQWFAINHPTAWRSHHVGQVADHSGEQLSKSVPFVRLVDRDDLENANLACVLEHCVNRRVGAGDMHPVPVAPAVDRELLLVSSATAWIGVVREKAQLLSGDPLGLLVGGIEERSGLVPEQYLVLRHSRAA